MSATQSELRLARLIDERELIRNKHESKLAEIEARDDKSLMSTDEEQLKIYREKAGVIDAEINDLSTELEAAKVAIEESKKIRRVLAGTDAIETDGDGIVYRTMAEYARDVILTGTGREAGKIAANVDRNDITVARERLQMLERVNNTLSSNVAGLNPPQHIAQIFQVINDSRPVVDSAQRTALERGQITFPVVTTRPVVGVQASEKTAGGDVGMVIDMVTQNADTYLGGGDLSWQAINWSTPNALDLWFRLVAADYALKTETAAGTEIAADASHHSITTRFGATGTFAQFMTAVGAGAAQVWNDSGRMANTVYMAPDRYWYIFGTTSDAFAQFTTVGGDGVGPLRFISTRGLDAGEIIVGDSQALLVAETAGAPVELRVVEPAIGGVEVGLIGAFTAVVTDHGGFSLITTAS